MLARAAKLTNNVVFGGRPKGLFSGTANRGGNNVRASTK